MGEIRMTRQEKREKQEEEIRKLIEENGGIVVAYENCTGAKSMDQLVDEEADDIYDAIARRYLQIG